jgi:hypothetical protein
MSADKNETAIIAMLEEIIANTKNQKTPTIDLSKVENLADRLEESIDSTTDCTAQMEQILEDVRKPIVNQRKITIEVVSKEVVFTFIGMIIIIVGLTSWLYFTTRPNHSREDNDLKYRYIRMKDGVTPKEVEKLEDIFDYNRNAQEIKSIRERVEKYEQTVKQEAENSARLRLNAEEAERLRKEAETIKKR